jgi:integrase
MQVAETSAAELQPSLNHTNLASATPLERGPKGPVPKRRYQEGTFRKENGHYYSFFYRDRAMPEGRTRSVKERFDHGKVGQISELSARREHDRLRQTINRERGSVPTAPKGETFAGAATAYTETIAPHLACSTARQRQSHLRFHLLPRFGTSALMALDVRSVQRFATELLQTNNRKTILNVLGTFFAVLDYARKCDIRVPEVNFSVLTIAPEKEETETPYFKPTAAAQIITAAREPYKTIFALAWHTGLRAGELLALTINDLDFDRKLILPRKQVDDSTRQLRELKTRKSKSPVAMAPTLEATLRKYLGTWRQNPSGLLFPNRNGRPRKRQYVVKFGLKPVLRKLGLPMKDVGLHAFRHGLGTALSENGASPKTVQAILRHTDIQTTFRYYVHSDVDAQRNALAAIGTNVPIGTEKLG